MLSTVNGEIHVSQSELIEELDTDVVNGNIVIEEVIATSTMNNIVNGDIVISNLYGKEVNASVVNADFKWNDVYVTSISINRLNGNIKLVNEDLNYQIKSIYKQISILHLRWQTKILISFIYKDTLSSRGHLPFTK